MSYMQPLVGLSDTKFDINLHKSEIDHDFFDNPCANEKFQAEDKTCNSDEVNNATTNQSTPEDRSQLNFVGSIEKVPKDDDDLKNPIQSEQFNGRQHKLTDRIMTKGAFCLSLDMTECRDAIPRSEQPNLIFSQTTQNRHNHNFSTRKLLECLTQDNEIVNSGPHSSFFDQYLPKDQVSEGSSGESGIAHDVPSDEQINILPAAPQTKKLFDLSSSSDSDSNSAISEGSLDTEDEEFVELLEKYYDYIDLEDSECSDITKVSPMSSMTDSPLPSFTERQNTAAVVDFSDGPNPIRFEDDPNAAMLSQKFKNYPVKLRSTPRNLIAGNKPQILPSGKPLPPLIIHTMEETIIPPDQLSYALSSILGISDSDSSQSQRKSKYQNVASLLMTVDDHDNQKNDDDGNIIKNNSHKMTSEGIEIKGKIRGRGRGEGILENLRDDKSLLMEHNNRAVTAVSTSSSSGMSFQSHSQSTSIPMASSAASGSNSSNELATRGSDRDNKMLIKNILEGRKSNGNGKAFRHNWNTQGNKPLKASATIIRQRQQRRIDHENAILMRRLQNVKPSKEITDAFRATSN